MALCLGLPGWAGARKVKPIWAEEEEKAWEKRNVFSLDLKTATESLY